MMEKRIEVAKTCLEPKSGPSSVIRFAISTNEGFNMTAAPLILMLRDLSELGPDSPRGRRR